MTAYFQNKIISILLPFVVIVIADFVWGDTTYAWQWLLMIVISIGYTHYGIGAYYQLATFRRQQKSTFLHVIFVSLVLLSAAIIYAFSALGLIWLVAFFVIPYFMLHGYFNEQTLFARSCKKASPDAVLAGIALWGTAATVFAFEHPSAFFSSNLTFLSAAEVQILITILHSVLFQYSFIGSIVLVLLTLVVLSYSVIRDSGPRVLLLFQLVVTLVASWYMYQFGPFNYVYLFVLLLGYHFLTWMIYFGRFFYTEQPGRFRSYVLMHVGILGGVWGGYWCVGLFSPYPTGLFFNSTFFLFLTLAHITTSFMNDIWFKKLIGIHPAV